MPPHSSLLIHRLGDRYGVAIDPYFNVLYIVQASGSWSDTQINGTFFRAAVSESRFKNSRGAMVPYPPNQDTDVSASKISHIGSSP